MPCRQPSPVTKGGVASHKIRQRLAAVRDAGDAADARYEHKARNAMRLRWSG